MVLTRRSLISGKLIFPEKTWCSFFPGKDRFPSLRQRSSGRQFALIHFIRIRKVAKLVKASETAKEDSLEGTPCKIKEISDFLKRFRGNGEGAPGEADFRGTPDRGSVREVVFSMLTAKKNAMQRAKNISNLIINDIEFKGGSRIPYIYIQELAFSIERGSIITEEKSNIFLPNVYDYGSSQTIWN